MSELETRLVGIVRAYPDLMTVLTTVRSLDLPDWLAFSGSIYQSVWNALTRRPAGAGVNDFDVGYFDPDTSWDAEDAVIRRVASAFVDPLKSRVEVRNQCRVPLWFKRKFGEDYGPVGSTGEALTRFVAPAFAVGVRLEPDDRITVVAPFGLQDTFDMIIRPNPRRYQARDWDRVTGRAADRWPELRILSTDDIA